MTVTIDGVNYLQITSMNTSTAGGTWAGSTPGEDLSSYKEGSGSMSFVMKTNGLNVTTFTPTSPPTLSGVKHLRFWMLSTHGGQFTQLEIGISGTGGPGYWVVATSTAYPGGWYQCVIDLSKDVHSGSKPTMTSPITSFIFRVTLTGGKNVANFWLDNLIICDGLQAYGDDAGGAFDFEDIRLTGISSDTGVISLYNGVYYLTGSLTIGTTATSSSNFVAKNQIVVFVDKSTFINLNLYAINIVGNGTGATQTFQLGENSGGAGINGCVIKCNIASMAFEFTSIDTYVDVFGLYGTTFDTYGTIDLQPHDAQTPTYVEVLNCSFVSGQGQLQPNTMTFYLNNIVSALSTLDSAILVESITHRIKDCMFISNSKAWEIETIGTYPSNHNQFIGNTTDINNTSAGAVTITVSNTPENSPTTSTGDTTIKNTVDVDVHIEDENSNAIEGAQVYVQKTTPTTYNSHATNNSQGDTTFEASAAVDTDTVDDGWVVVWAIDEKRQHWYRYLTRTTTSFSFPTAVTGTQTGTSSSTVLIDSAADFYHPTSNPSGTEDVTEGDIIRNTTDGSYTQVKSVDSGTQLTTLRLVSGSDRTWQNGDSYSIHTLVQNYDASDTFRVPLINLDTDSTGDVTTQYNHPGGEPSITIRVRHSPTSGVKYYPAQTSGIVPGTGFSTTIVLIRDTTAT